MSVIKRSDLIEDSAIQWPEKYKKDLEELIATSKKLGESAKGIPGASPKTKKNVSELQKVQKQLNVANEKSNKVFIEQKAALDRVNKANRERTKTLNENIALENKQIGTLEKLALTNKKLVEERKKLNLETTKGQKRLKEINKDLDKNNKRIKDNNDALGKQKINIGNYQNALSGLPGPLGAAARATQALTGSTLKFIATPIGAVVAALGLAIGALTTFFKGSEEGQNAFTKVTKAALVVWGNFKDVIIDVGKGLFKLVSLDFKGAKDAFNDAADGVKNFVSESKAEIAIQNQLSDLRAKNIKLQRELTVEEAKIRRDVAKFREDAAKTEETDAANSAKLLRQAIILQDELAAKREEVSRNNLEILREEAKLSESTTETLNEIANAEAALINIQTERSNLVKRLTKELNTLDKKAEAQAKNQVKLAVNTFNEIKAKAPTVEEKLDVVAPTTEALKERLDANLEIYKENQEKLNEIDQQRKDDRNEIITASIDTSKQIFSDFTALRIQQISQELEATEFARNRELESAEGNKRKEAEINAQFDAKRRDLERKQLNANKANALFNIAINTAVAISKVAANPILIALAAAIGISQAALVLSQSVPQFDEGTESTPKDYIAGEKRPELKKSKGKWSLITEPTLFRNSPGDKIVGGEETDSILGTMADLTGKNLLTNPDLITGLIKNDFNYKSERDNNLAQIIERGNNKVVRAITRKPTANISVHSSRSEVTETFGRIKVNRLDAYYYGRG